MLSKKTQYSIYALIHLAREYNKGPVLISQISKEELLPKKFLETILLDLKNFGIVNSKKGKGGGYYLIKKPEEINLADIIRHFDGAIALLPCVSHNYYETCEHCKDELTCGFRFKINELRDINDKFLKNTTIADILRKGNSLKKKNNQ